MIGASFERRRALAWMLVPAAQLIVPAAWAIAGRIGSARLWPAQEYTRVIFESPAPIEHPQIGPSAEAGDSVRGPPRKQCQRFAGRQPQHCAHPRRLGKRLQKFGIHLTAAHHVGSFIRGRPHCH